MKPKIRWNSGYGYIGCSLFYKAINKYGWNSFTHEIVADGLTQEEAENLEIQLIKEYKSTNRNYGYNLSAGGSGTRGIPCSEHKKQKCSIGMIKKRRIKSTDKKINQIDIETNKIVRIWQSITEIEIELGIECISAIRGCITGRNKSAFGFYWQVINSEVNNEK